MTKFLTMIDACLCRDGHRKSQKVDAFSSCSFVTRVPRLSLREAKERSDLTNPAAFPYL